MGNKKWLFTRLENKSGNKVAYLIIKMIHMMRGKKYR